MSDSCPRCARPRWRAGGGVSPYMVSHCFQSGDPTCQLAEQRNTAQAALRALITGLRGDAREYVDPQLDAVIRTAEAVVEYREHLYSKFCFCETCSRHPSRLRQDTSTACTHEPEPFSPVCRCSDDCRCRKDKGPCATEHIPE